MFINGKKIILGTANLGQNYGITNNSAFDIDVSKSILRNAISNNVTDFDTAPDYGVAQELLASEVTHLAGINITTKISSKITGKTDDVVKHFKDSLSVLNVNQVDSVLFHSSRFVEDRNFRDLVDAILETQQTKRVGISVYEIDEIATALDTGAQLTLFQVPENILDRRLEKEPEMETYHSQGIKFVVRSIFLQGALLTNEVSLPANFKAHKDAFRKLNESAKQQGLSVLELCVNYVLNINWAEGILIAAATIEQLDEILSVPLKKLQYEDFPTLPSYLADPRNWTKV